MKEIVAMPVVYAGNLTYLDYTDYGVTYGNDTPLAKYWRAEYLKTHTWSVERDGISLVIYPKYITGDYETEAIGFIVVLNSSKYIDRVKYISNGTEMAIKNGGDISVSLVEGEGYKREYTRYLYLPGDPNATYFCYIPSENKVVISDHIVEGTKYFFVEKDERLSRIVEVRR